MKSDCDVFAVQFSNSAPECKNMLDILHFIEPHRVCYAQLYKAYQIACTIPITTKIHNQCSGLISRGLRVTKWFLHKNWTISFLTKT